MNVLKVKEEDDSDLSLFEQIVHNGFNPVPSTMWVHEQFGNLFDLKTGHSPKRCVEDNKMSPGCLNQFQSTKKKSLND